MTFKRDSWAILANYESSDLVKKQYNLRHGRSLTAQKAREICTAFAQARSYMQSAQGADRIVRPLLVYYGVLAFSRALTLFLSPKLTESGLSQSHGLTVKSWAEELNKDGGDVGSLRVALNAKGSLLDLMKATGHQALLRSNCSAPNFACVFDVPKTGTEFSLNDLLSRFPEIRDTYSRWRTDRNMVKIEMIEHLPDGARKLRIPAPYTYEDVTAVFGKELPILNAAGHSIDVRCDEDETFPSLTDVSGSWDVGSIVVLSKFPADIEFSKIASYFCVSYMLGMLVRYYPSHWISMNHNVKFGAALPSLLAALDHIESDFARLVVEFLEPPANLEIANSPD